MRCMAAERFRQTVPGSSRTDRSETASRIDQCFPGEGKRWYRKGCAV